MTSYQILAVLVMALFTYLPRFLPLTFFRKKITSKFINSALYYLPYAVLGALTFPGVFNSTPHLVESCAGILVAVFLVIKEMVLYLWLLQPYLHLILCSL